jgi:hypothetical protein
MEKMNPCLRGDDTGAVSFFGDVGKFGPTPFPMFFEKNLAGWLIGWNNSLFGQKKKKI